MRYDPEPGFSTANRVADAIDKVFFRLIAKVVTLGHDDDAFALSNSCGPLLDVFETRGDTSAQRHR